LAQVEKEKLEADAQAEQERLLAQKLEEDRIEKEHQASEELRYQQEQAAAD